jgi:hypothetical protein
MILSSRMGHGSWWILHLDPTQSTASGYSRMSTNQMAHLKSTRKGSKDLDRKKVFIMRRILPPWKNGLPSILYFPWNHRMDGKLIKWMWRLLS